MRRSSLLTVAASVAVTALAVLAFAGTPRCVPIVGGTGEWMDADEARAAGLPRAGRSDPTGFGRVEVRPGGEPGAWASLSRAAR